MLQGVCFSNSTRYVYTAWTVFGISYSSSMSAKDVWTANVLYPQPPIDPGTNTTDATNATSTTNTTSATNTTSVTNATKPTNTILNGSPSPMPTTYALDRPVFANVLYLTLNSTPVLKSPYFEVRGCDVEGKKFCFFPYELVSSLLCILVFGALGRASDPYLDHY